MIIAQTYLHFRYFPDSAARIHTEFEALKQIAYESARRAYQYECTIGLVAEEGSLKEWLSVATVLGVLQVASGYDGLKRNVPLMIEDGRKFSQYVVDHIVTTLDLKTRQNLVTQSRRAVPGQLQAVLEEVEALKRDVLRLDQAAVDKRFERIRQRLARINRQLPTAETQALLNAFRETRIPGLPKSPSELDVPRVALRADDKRHRPDSSLGLALPVESKGLAYEQMSPQMPTRRPRIRLEDTITVSPPTGSSFLPPLLDLR